MLLSHKNRQLENGQKVSCFWNLHKDVFSIESNIMERGKKRKLICMYGNYIMLNNVTFSVNKKGRERVLQEKRKNVHAYVKGELYIDDDNPMSLQGMREAYYNPYKQDYFSDKETGEKINYASQVILLNKKIYYK